MSFYFEIMIRTLTTLKFSYENLKWLTTINNLCCILFVWEGTFNILTPLVLMANLDLLTHVRAICWRDWHKYLCCQDILHPSIVHKVHIKKAPGLIYQSICGRTISHKIVQYQTSIFQWTDLQQIYIFFQWSFMSCILPRRCVTVWSTA